MILRICLYTVVTITWTVLFPGSALQKGATLTVEITGAAPASSGQVKVSLWLDEKAFLKGKAYKIASIEQKKGMAIAIFRDVEPGIYAVSAYHDVNGNGRLDTGFLGKPTEPYGFSNNARSMFGPPAFQDAKFGFQASDQTIKIGLK